jgi:phosphoribosylformylglycinamidine synthase
VALLDNFCWPDPVKSPKTPDGEYKLAQLVRANKALYDYTKAFNAPCVSGKDSMKNDSVLGGKKISIPPSLLISAITRMEDVSRAVTPDAKNAGDDIYVVGTTKLELGGSEYLAMLGKNGGAVPQIDSAAAAAIHRAVAALTEKRLARSIHAPAHGGLAVSLAKTAMAGRLGLQVDIDAVPTEPSALSAREILFSESGARFLVTAKPERSAEIAEILADAPHAKIGRVIAEPVVKIRSGGAESSVRIDDLLEKYKSTLDGV